MRPKKVCLCMSVTETEIIKAIKNGANTMDKLIEETSATLGCGTCSAQVMMILEREKSKT